MDTMHPGTGEFLQGISKELGEVDSGNWSLSRTRSGKIDPLTCPKCQGQMRIIAFIKDEEVIEKILKHLGLWDLKAIPPPKVKAPFETICLDDSGAQILPLIPYTCTWLTRCIPTGFQNRTECLHWL